MVAGKKIVFVALVVMLISTLTACSQGPQTIDAALTTYKIALSSNTANAGDITFHVHNDATDLTHEFVIFKTDLPEDQLPLTPEGIVDEEGEGITAVDEVEDVEVGTAKDLKVNLQPGKYVLLCNTDSDKKHYSHGMHVAFTVK